jgi:hypothetical protein
MKHFKLLPVLALLTLTISCQKHATQDVKQEGLEIQYSTQRYSTQSVNDSLAAEIKKYITTEFIKDDELKLMTEDQRKFQFYQIDMNNDGELEVFVNFITSYFCGTGGCTILLLDNHLKPITKFTVTRTPLFAEQTMKNGWRILLTTSRGELKELVYENGSYPPNPSMVGKAPYDAPSGHAEIMFDMNYSNPKSYSF